jgi:hypothetical protein
MSDQDYMAFLNKANEDPAAGVASGNSAPQKHPAFRATEDGVEVPEAIKKLVGRHGGDGVCYTSDADEPFEAVALAWDEAGRGLPDEGRLSICFSFSDSCVLGLRGRGC